MLQKEFFQVQPFNPNPYWNPVIVNLSGAQKFEQNTVFVPGRYKVVIQAGGTSRGGTSEYPVYSVAGKIQKIINVQQPFIIRAYCGSRFNGATPGANPYTGTFKVNPRTGDAPSVTHVFGTCGASDKWFYGVSEGFLGSGNCLGDGWSVNKFSTWFGCGAGSCLHLLPINGIFGTDFLFAFHTTAGTDGTLFYNGGGGSALGGSASGGVSSTGSQGSDAQNGFIGGSTPYGSGGPRANSGTGALSYNVGYDGEGIGHGYAPNNGFFRGAAAFFNGTSWEQVNEWANEEEDGVIKIEYLGPLN